MPYAENCPPHTLMLDNALSVWRYVSFPSFVYLLQRRQLFFAKLATLAEQDPFEGKYPRSVLAELGSRYTPQFAKHPFPDGETFARDAERRNRGYRAVNCWHLGETESAAMWKLYSGERGLAIRSTLGALKEAFAADERPVYIYEVEYLDFSESTNAALPFLSGYAKRKSFAYERELRACTFVADGDASRGTLVSVDLEKLIGKVYIAPDSDSWMAQMVEDLMQVYGTFKRVIASDLYRDAVV